MDKDKKFDFKNLAKKFPAAAEYLIEIFVIKRDYGIVKNSVIAARLGVSKPAVTQAMNRLKKFNLLEQDLYGSINLTVPGRIIASRLLKRHYLIEHLLIHYLDYPWDKSDEEAARIQATLSDEFTDYLFERLNRPDTCPHGNPFPGSNREMEILSAPRLSTVSSGVRLKLVRITEEGEGAEGLLHFCCENDLKPGRTMIVDNVDEQGVTVRLEDGTQLMIPDGVADYLCFMLV